MVKGRDILAELARGELSVDQAYEYYDFVMDSDWGGSDPQTLLGMSPTEWTAKAQGVGFAELATWRAEGWPTTCRVCGLEIHVTQYGWMAKERADGLHELVHVLCL